MNEKMVPCACGKAMATMGRDGCYLCPWCRKRHDEITETRVTPLPKLTLKIAQDRLEAAKKVAFKDYPNAITNPLSRALNICEEAGELAREERLDCDGMGFDRAKAIDAIGDIFVATLGYCIARQWNAQYILETTVGSIVDRWESGQLVGIPASDEDERQGKP